MNIKPKRIMICGIYKITNPIGKIYIGQSIDIDRRWRDHKQTLNNKNKNKLIESFLEYGYNNHIFEIIEECKKEDLKDLERFYQDKYNVLYPNGLNLKLTGTNLKSPVLHSDYLNKMITNNSNRITSEETRRKLSIASKGRTMSPEAREKIRQFNIGRIVTPEVRLKISITLKNKYK